MTRALPGLLGLALLASVACGDGGRTTPSPTALPAALPAAPASPAPDPELEAFVGEVAAALGQELALDAADTARARDVIRAAWARVELAVAERVDAGGADLDEEAIADLLAAEQVRLDHELEAILPPAARERFAALSASGGDL